MAQTQTTHKQQLFSWGRQREGQGGRPEDVDDQTFPRIVENYPVKVKLIASGIDRSLVVTDDDQMWSFGRGWMGELGLAYKTQTSYPDHITKAPKLKWKQIACGSEHTLALSEDGEIWSWGANELGQLGQGHTKMVDRPAKVLSDQRFTCIAAGVSHSIALTEFGEVFTWGGKYSGQLGSSRPVDFTVPCKVEADGETLPSFKFVTAGDYCSAAISISGDLYMWGSGAHGRLGLGNTISFDIPQHVPELDQVKMVSVTANHVIALTDTNCVFTWGANHNGELGNGLRQRQLRPIEIKTPETLSSVHAGYETSFGIGDSGALYVWGSCAHGVLGIGRKIGDILVPTRLNTPLLFRGLSVHRRHVLAICQGSAETPANWSKEAELVDPRIEQDRLLAEAKKAAADAKIKTNTETEEAYLAEAAKRVVQQNEKLEHTKIAVVKRQEDDEEAKRKEQEEKQKKLMESARRAALKKAEEEAKLRGEDIGVSEEKGEGQTEAPNLPEDEDDDTRRRREREERRRQREREAAGETAQPEPEKTEPKVQQTKEEPAADSVDNENEERERKEREEKEKRELEELEREEEEAEERRKKEAEEKAKAEEKSLSLEEDSGTDDNLDEEEARLKAEEEELARLEAEEAELARLEAELGDQDDESV